MNVRPGGDFNEILEDCEKLGGSQRASDQLTEFRQVLDDCELCDLGYYKDMFTWCNRRDASDQVSLHLTRLAILINWARA